MTIRINERGVPLAVDEAARIDDVGRRSKVLLNEEAAQLSRGAFGSVNQVEKVLDWVNKRMS